MKELNKKNIKSLFSGLCCSQCRNDFTKDSFYIKEVQGDILICSLKCEKCFKDFGDIIFFINKKSDNHSSLEVIEGPPPISVDDVIDAHEFIKKL